ncbi:MAG: PKD domain-containing protein [Bacteroidetes bacterium]|nr:PKD domain-containing protein [Bacteroidota bacterium]
MNPSGQVNDPADLVVCNTASASVTFGTLNSGGTTTYSWSNNTTSIGLGATGIGDISLFTTTNTGTSPVVATISVTPTFTNEFISCTGAAQTFTITVNPSGHVNSIVDKSLCHMEITAPMYFTTNNTGGTTSYTWSNDNVSIGLGSSGIDYIPSFTAINTSISNVVGNISVIPTFTNGSSGCTGSPGAFTITVNQTPIIPNRTLTVCSGHAFTITPHTFIPDTIVPANTTYSWNTPAVSSPLLLGGIAGTGMSNISCILTNYSTANQTAVYTVTPKSGTSGNCDGAPFTITIEVVLPQTPTISSTAQAVTPCVNSANNVYSTEPGMTNYTWTGVNPPNTFTVGPTSNSITVTWVTPGLKMLNVSYASPYCDQVNSSIPYQVFVMPLPTPSITSVPPGINSCCMGDPPITFSTESGMTGYSWVVTGGVQVGGNGNTISVLWNSIGPPPPPYNVSVSYTDGFGCTSASPTIYPFTVNPIPPTPTVFGNSTACEGSTVNYTTEGGMSGYNWNVTPPGTITFTGNSAVATFPSPGTYQVTAYFHNASNCYPLLPGTKTVVVHPVPVPVVTSGPESVCDSSTAIYSTVPNQSSYFWTIDPPSTIPSGQGTSTVTVKWIRNGNSSHTIRVNYTSPDTCAGVDPTPVYNVTVNPVPVPSFINTPPVSACVDSISDTYKFTTQSGKVNYVWDYPLAMLQGGGGSNDDFVRLSWNSPGQKTVQVSYSEPGPPECPALTPAIHHIAVEPRPAPYIIGADTVCKGDVKQYFTQSGMAEYIWAVSGGGEFVPAGVSNTNPVTVRWRDHGIQSISVDVKNSNGCWASQSTDSIVWVNPKPSATIMAMQNERICAGTGGWMYRTIPGQEQYEWTTSEGSINILGNGLYEVTVTWNTPGPQWIKCKVTNASHCDSVSDPYPVEVVPRANPVITAPFGQTISCSDSLNNIYRTDPGMLQYHWTVEGGTFIPPYDGYEVTVTWGATGPYSVSVNYENANNLCLAVEPATLTVDVRPRPTAAFTYSLSVCDSTITLMNNSGPNNPPNTTFQWNFGDGTIVPNNPAPIPHDYRTTNLYRPSYLVSLKVINTNLCPDTTSTRVMMRPCVKADFTYNALMGCARYDMLFKDNSMDTNYISKMTWDWDDGFKTTYNSYHATATHSFEASGTYHVNLLIETSVGTSLVTDNVTKPVTINPTPLPDFTSKGMCRDQVALFTDKSVTYDPYGDLDITRLWNFGDPTTLLNNQSTLTNPGHKFSKVGLFEVKLVINNKYGCSDTRIDTLRVHRLPTAEFTHSMACTDKPVNFTNQTLISDTTIHTWGWDFGDLTTYTDVSADSCPAYQYNYDSNYLVRLIIEDNFGCLDTASSTLKVYTSPVSAFTVTSNYNGKQGQIELNNQSVGDSLSYLWNFGNGKHSTEKDPVALYTEDNSYTIMLISRNKHDCADTTYFQYEMLFKGLFVPNAFQPESTNLGVRLFKPIGGNLKQYHVSVFDIWGHLMWESTAIDAKGMPAQGWDGTFEGVLQPQGNYIWKISALFLDDSQWEGSDIGVGTSTKTMGTVTLIR